MTAGRRSIKNELLLIVFASILPLTMTLFWLLRNLQLPMNDASNYLMTAIDIYHQFTDKGVLKGILSCYTLRGWRPIFFPVLSVPFLLISKGNLIFAYKSVAMITLAVSTFYLYLFFRLKLDRISAIIATNLVGLLPLIQAQVVMF